MDRKKIIINKTDILEVITRLPSVEKFDISNMENTIDDILIIVNGFEDRANALICKLPTINYSANKVFIAKYQTNLDDNSIGYPELLQSVDKICNQYEDLDADNEANIRNSLLSYLGDLSVEVPNVTVDISAASDRLILAIMHTFLLMEKNINLEIIYYEAGEYNPSHDFYTNDPKGCIRTIMSDATTHEEGIDKVFMSSLYTGHTNEYGYSEYLIAIPTLKTNRMIAMLDDYDSEFFSNKNSESVFWILGRPEQKHSWREELQKKVLTLELEKQQIGDALIAENNTLSCSTLDYLDILQSIVEIVDGNPKKKITIMPMGSKMQTIGVSLALFTRSECSVLLARPKRFNANSYSNGVGPGWQIKFDNLEQVKKELLRINCLSTMAPENKILDTRVQT